MDAWWLFIYFAYIIATHLVSLVVVSSAAGVIFVVFLPAIIVVHSIVVSLITKRTPSVEHSVYHCGYL